MSTKWISLCDMCGKEETSGDDKAHTLFDVPHQPDSAFFRFSRTNGEARETQLDLDLCGECGAKLHDLLRSILPDPRLWTEEVQP